MMGVGWSDGMREVAAPQIPLLSELSIGDLALSRDGFGDPSVKRGSSGTSASFTALIPTEVGTLSLHEVTTSLASALRII